MIHYGKCCRTRLPFMVHAWSAACSAGATSIPSAREDLPVLSGARLSAFTAEQSPCAALDKSLVRFSDFF